MSLRAYPTQPSFSSVKIFGDDHLTYAGTESAILLYSESANSASLRSYGEIFPDVDSDALISVVKCQSLDEGSINLEIKDGTLMSGDEAEQSQVLHVTHGQNAYILQQRTADWKAWFDEQKRIEAQIAQSMKHNADVAEQFILDHLYAAYEKLMDHQRKPEAQQTADILKDYEASRYSKLEEAFSELSPGLENFDNDRWDKELDLSESIEDRRACVVSMVGALALSQIYTHKHLPSPVTPKKSRSFATLLLHARTLQRLCLLDVDLNRFMDASQRPVRDLEDPAIQLQRRSQDASLEISISFESI